MFEDIDKQQNFSKIIHITYKNIEKLEHVKNEWIRLNPNYLVKLYDDAMCIEFINQHFDKKYTEIFNYITDGPIKCDFFRCCVIYICGGIYVDADIKPLIPLNEYIEDDVDFATCISYNFKKDSIGFKYNPHFIVSKKNNVFLYKTLKKYENLFDTKQPYSYWKWSICRLFIIDEHDDITNEILNDKNIIIHNNKKYQFLIETLVKDKIEYNFKNIDDIKETTFSYEQMFCKYNNEYVISNFSNKFLLV